MVVVIIFPAPSSLDIDVRIAEAVGDARVAASEAAHAATQAATRDMTAQMSAKPLLRLLAFKCSFYVLARLA